MHDVALDLGCEVPSGQRVQAGEPALKAKLPGAHAVVVDGLENGTEEMTEEMVVQEAGFLCLLWLLNTTQKRRVHEHHRK